MDSTKISHFIYFQDLFILFVLRTRQGYQKSEIITQRIFGTEIQPFFTPEIALGYDPKLYRIENIIIRKQKYVITQERLDDMLFYKDVSILFHLYRLAGNIQSFQCRLFDEKVVTPFDQ